MNKLPTTNRQKPAKKDYSLTIGWLYPELMSTYGDRGNIIVLQKRCEWRGIEVKIQKLEIGYKVADLQKCDFLFMGGAQDLQQQLVAKDFTKEKVKVLKDMIEDGMPGAYICGAYQFLGKYYKEADGTIIDGLGIFDLYTENPGTNHPRLIGNIIIKPNPNVIQVSGAHPGSHSNSQENVKDRDSGQARMTNTLVGFENHGGRTHLGKGVKPLGIVKIGFGNNGEDKTEGAIYKNSFGSYLHGPILPKNPAFADYLIKLALETKYKKEIALELLDDSLEIKAHEAILKKIENK